MRRPGDDLKNPEFLGANGRAWPMVIPEEQKSAASLGEWMIEDTVTVRYWNYHVASLIHLREIPGLAPPVIDREGATHEFLMFALDPAHENDYDPESIDSVRGHLMTPPDIVHQLVMPGDDRALEVCRFAIQKCVEGELPADSDFYPRWKRYFDNQEATS